MVEFVNLFLDSGLKMKLYLCFMAFTAFIVLAAGQDNEETTYPASEASEVCSLNKLIDEKCTKEDDIPCRRCYFKACHKPGEKFDQVKLDWKIVISEAHQDWAIYSRLDRLSRRSSLSLCVNVYL